MTLTSLGTAGVLIPEPTTTAVGVILLIVAGVFLIADSATNTETRQRDNTKQTLFHYSKNPVWRGDVFEEGQYLTDDPTMSSQEARLKLALPTVAEGQKLYLYRLEVKSGDVTMPRPVEPKQSNITEEVLPGGGTEYQATRPLPMFQVIGIPVRND
jgi:hypothetical protein